jgi:hypothetical protein
MPKRRRISTERHRKLGGDFDHTIDMVGRQGGYHATHGLGIIVPLGWLERRWMAVHFFHVLAYTTSKSSMA